MKRVSTKRSPSVAGSLPVRLPWKALPKPAWPATMAPVVSAPARLPAVRDLAARVAVDVEAVVEDLVDLGEDVRVERIAGVGDLIRIREGVAVGIRVVRIRAVDGDLVTIVQSVTVGVRVVRIGRVSGRSGGRPVPVRGVPGVQRAAGLRGVVQAVGIGVVVGERVASIGHIRPVIDAVPVRVGIVRIGAVDVDLVVIVQPVIVGVLGRGAIGILVAVDHAVAVGVAEGAVVARGAVGIEAIGDLPEVGQAVAVAILDVGIIGSL